MGLLLSPRLHPPMSWVRAHQKGRVLLLPAWRVAGSEGASGDDAVGGGALFGVRRARASRTLAKMKPTSMPQGA